MLEHRSEARSAEVRAPVSAPAVPALQRRVGVADASAARWPGAALARAAVGPRSAAREHRRRARRRVRERRVQALQRSRDRARAARPRRFDIAFRRYVKGPAEGRTREAGGAPPRSAAQRDFSRSGADNRGYRQAALTPRGAKATLRRSYAPRQGCEARDGTGKLGPRPARASQSVRILRPSRRSRPGAPPSHGARRRRAVLRSGRALRSRGTVTTSLRSCCVAQLFPRMEFTKWTRLSEFPSSNLLKTFPIGFQQ